MNLRLLSALTLAIALPASGCSDAGSDPGDSGAGAGSGSGGAGGDDEGGPGEIAGGGGGNGLSSAVSVIITADNAYGFGYGTGDELLSYFGGIENNLAGEIFSCPIGNGPESYTVPAESANAGHYLYIITYADKLTTQGVIGQFFREGAEPVFTGNGGWEVCATGEDYDLGSHGPTLETINQQLARCNRGDLDPQTSSAGWVTTEASAHGHVVFGEANDTPRTDPEPGNEFPIVCGIDEEARWMWYEWEPDRSTGSPFLWPSGSAGNVTKDFLIFRLGAELIPEVPR
ncbi:MULTISPECIES: hypothetical protein [Sorangium]|uniref:Secreted protein n=1 Tax=Sorangium cellulosum TaxID=56 RepID=A0A4P2QJ76_SORCE|nr:MULTISPECIES: hypothetical protein [Sorangium]AUX30000.1 hypothetical protein SOCE836_020950 [Sorangium cellulosum]WCQ89390.1 hypothetical protein NQZ70_02077 [Sorangium sp. Soce836]